MRCRSFTLLNDCSTTVTRPSAADGANDSNEAGAAAGNENLTVRTQSIAGVASGSPTGRSWPSAVILAQEHERQLRPISRPSEPWHPSSHPPFLTPPFSSPIGAFSFSANSACRAASAETRRDESGWLRVSSGWSQTSPSRGRGFCSS